MSARSMIISLGHELSEQDNKAFDLWTWLPSHKAAQAAHGDYASEHTPLCATFSPRRRCSFRTA